MFNYLIVMRFWAILKALVCQGKPPLTPRKSVVTVSKRNRKMWKTIINFNCDIWGQGLNYSTFRFSDFDFDFELEFGFEFECEFEIEFECVSLCYF